MLANGRADMVKRAVKSFRAQTYENKHLLMYDTSEDRIHDLCDLVGIGMDDEDVTIREANAINHHGNKKTIGYLRNRANSNVEADIICHWDSDDWSHANRIAEQVALLQSSGAECVGYNEMLFWEEFWESCAAYGPGDVRRQEHGRKAWIWRENIKNYAVGTSMMYWRETWERAQFPDYSAGCDDLYWAHGDKKKGIAAVKIESVSSLTFDGPRPQYQSPGTDPMMIASIHGGNTCAKIDAKGKEWTRVPQWDSYCRREMAL